MITIKHGDRVMFVCNACGNTFESVDVDWSVFSPTGLSVRPMTKRSRINTSCPCGVSKFIEVVVK